MYKTFSCFSGCNIKYSSEVAALISAPSRKRPLIDNTPNQSQDTNKTLRVRTLQVKDESLLYHENKSSYFVHDSVQN